MELARSHQIENLRRSIAMLSPGQPALNREQALELVNELLRLRRAIEHLAG